MPLGEGEHPNARRAMDDLTRRLVGEGMKPKEAADRAREVALRHDTGKPPNRKPPRD